MRGEGVSGEAYELVAMLMRYVFVLLGLVILFRAYRWMRRDAKGYQREMRSLPDAGLVGEIVDLQTGASQPLPREGTIGSARHCDIWLKYPGVKRRHALLSFEEGKGVCFVPQHRGRILVDGEAVSGPCYAIHGTQLQLGGCVIRVRLFAGLKVPHPVPYMDDMMAENAYPPFMEYPISENMPQPPYPQQGQYMPEQEAAPLGYAGDYTEDGEMTWQFAAYPLEELRRAQMQQEQMYQQQAYQQLAYQQQALQEQPTPMQQMPPMPPVQQAEMANEEDEEAALYQSPLPRRRRRD